MTCRDCKHFAAANHIAYCRRRGKYLIPDGYSCPNFESKYQITTTRNPYLEQLYTIDDIAFAAPYCKKDVEFVSGLVRKEYNKMFKMDKVKKVIFNPPATIVYWGDGTKTVVKAQNGDGFDREKGFAMACAKKFFGNKGSYYNEFRKHDAIGGVEFVETDETLSWSHDGEKIGKIIRSGIEEGVYRARVELTCDSPVPETYVKIPTLDAEPVGRTKSDYIIEKIKEFTSDFWMLKVYSELDTKEWMLDIGVMNNDMGNSMRFIIYLEDVEWEHIDESIGRVTSSIANELIPSVWKKESE